MKPNITEINIIPIKPQAGLVAFASFVLDSNLYLGSIGIVTRPEGGFRLVYPTKKIEQKSLNLFHPINKSFAEIIEKAVLTKYEELVIYRGIHIRKESK